MNYKNVYLKSIVMRLIKIWRPQAKTYSKQVYKHIKFKIKNDDYAKTAYSMDPEPMP